ncbi:MerR family transcriptional regulator [Plantactinospora solaniradicis]|uniref:MerR family transcriptional regulator n=1 Tax=Plantactinospora solaniradicis TaxID=1723736 RepID=A0ABW1KLD2_9ACTN
MRIGEFSRRAGVSERSLRYYEQQGLLRPARQSSGYRAYQESDLRTVRHIRTLLAAGLNTETIAELLPCMVEDGGRLGPGCAELLPVLRRDRERVDRALADLATARSILDAMIAAPIPVTGAANSACEPVDAPA